MNKKFLKLELDFDFILLSITSQLRDYRLCHYINKALDFNFEKVDDHEITFVGQSPKFYSKYLYYIEEVTPFYYLISNKGSDGYLIPELKGSDYFVIIKDFIDDEDLQYFIQTARNIPDIQAIVELDPTKLKSKENLIF
ncbi:hypothetical protein Pedsa_2758 [Pseudopedobacter saltans DSM 12145]|uniref:IPExxxVDY family protein n=1 Tax=Pseudopedobacter saltans (strain ATCC 51119 / DSM 12145 / JCM 21818 / CCUG 39354 / LMG 10337 / NBRC 100064 / NCIMB 13643) TaxID=762903 RepID=F0S7P4_PSESL|nr:IPExxxVDY family protein [Pseudopedobacter saltans]ADY53299.1 hypothetical protein Pedsa_2758 [Pseudopedobacter saltans DSM 12145]